MNRIFNRTTHLTVFFAAILAGIGVSRLYYFPGIIWIILFSVLAIVLAKRKTLMLLIVLICLGLCIGWWRGSAQLQKVQELLSYTGQKVTIHVTATEDAVYDDRGQLSFSAGNAELVDPKQKSLIGNFRISGFGEPMVYRGDRVEVFGRLYETRGSKQAGISFAQLNKIQGSPPSLLESARQKFIAGTYNALPEPLGSFVLGLLVGQRSTLPEATALALSIVGLTHIIAVSGYNLTILVRAVSRVRFLGSKFQRLIFSYTLISLFILVTGFSASIVRAGLVAGIGLLAWYYGRNLKPILLILMVAAITGLFRPLYVWSDIGWYLSFLAFFGVLILAPLIAARLFKKNEPKTIIMMLIETIAAQIMTMPLIMLIFGEVSTVSVLANLLVVPFVPFAMLFGLIAGTAGALLPTLAGLFALPAKLILTYMLDIADWLASWPNALAQLNISVSQMLAMYGLITVFVLVLHKKAGKLKRHSFFGK